MTGQRIKAKALAFLTGSLLTAVAGVAQPVTAHAANPLFTEASLKGRYAYLNNTGDVASLGPVVFDGMGGLRLKITANTPCATPVPGCPRTLTTLDAVGTYSIEPDGTGLAIVGFPAPTGPVTYNLVISQSVRRAGRLLATEVFAAGQSGGLAGQLIAPVLTLQTPN